jgi:hypothetical protein
MYLLPLEAFACLEILPPGHDRTVLLSVVAQALLYNSPFFDNVDDG